MFMIAQENLCGVFFFYGCVFFSQHILNKANIYTYVLFCGVKCPLTTTVMEKNRNQKFCIQRGN